MNRLFEEKKTRYRNLLLLILPFLIGVVVFAFMAKGSLKDTLDFSGNNNAEEKVGDEFSIPSQGFKLRANATDLQKEIFAKLKAAIETPNPELSEYDQKCEIIGNMAASFIADYYTWSNKNATYDVGGMTYLDPDIQFGMYYKSRDDFYKYVSYYIQEYGAENLPEVTDLEIATACQLGGTYDTYTGSYPVYSAWIKWGYKNNSPIDIKDFYIEQYVTIIEKEGQFRIVEVYKDYE